MLIFLFVAFRRLFNIIGGCYYQFLCYALFKGNGIVHGNYRTIGVPYVMVSLGGKLTIGKNFAMNNGIKGNPIGCYDRCTFWVGKGAVLRIGDNVGISQAALVAIADITIGNNVKIVGGTSIFTSDFHALDPKIRASSEDLLHRKCAPVIIEDNAFIGARSIILKGVKIGKNSIVGAGSIVTKSVPENEIWAGNPARFVRKI